VSSWVAARQTLKPLLPDPLIRVLRSLRRQRELAAFKPRVVEHSYGGVALRVAIGSPYGERYDRDWPRLAEIELLRRHSLRPGARVFNLGASHGVIALMLADAVGPDGTVVALEACPIEAAALRRNRELNDAAQLVCLNAAAAAHSGEVLFGLNGEVDDSRRRWAGSRVPALSIDDLSRRYGPPDVLFVDVEGYELEVLAGARRTLAARPDWFVEIHGYGPLHHFGGSINEVIGAFRSEAYECFVADDQLVVDGSGELHCLTHFEPLGRAGEQPGGRFFLIALGRD
jgi:FkbM family methyltransferase